MRRWSSSLTMMATVSSPLMATPRGAAALGVLAADQVPLDQQLAVQLAGGCRRPRRTSRRRCAAPRICSLERSGDLAALRRRCSGDRNGHARQVARQADARGDHHVAASARRREAIRRRGWSGRSASWLSSSLIWSRSWRPARSPRWRRPPSARPRRRSSSLCRCSSPPARRGHLADVLAGALVRPLQQRLQRLLRTPRSRAGSPAGPPGGTPGSSSRSACRPTRRTGGPAPPAPGDEALQQLADRHVRLDGDALLAAAHSSHRCFSIFLPSTISVRWTVAGLSHLSHLNRFIWPPLYRKVGLQSGQAIARTRHPKPPARGGDDLAPRSPSPQTATTRTTKNGRTKYRRTKGRMPHQALGPLHLVLVVLGRFSIRLWVVLGVLGDLHALRVGPLLSLAASMFPCGDLWLPAGLLALQQALEPILHDLLPVTGPFGLPQRSASTRLDNCSSWLA